MKLPAGEAAEKGHVGILRFSLGATCPRVVSVTESPSSPRVLGCHRIDPLEAVLCGAIQFGDMVPGVFTPVFTKTARGAVELWNKAHILQRHKAGKYDEDAFVAKIIPVCEANLTDPSVTICSPADGALASGNQGSHARLELPGSAHRSVGGLCKSVRD